MSEKINIPESWIIATIGDLCITSSGGTPSRKNKSFYNGSIPWVKSGELKYGTILKTKETITEEAVNNSSAKLMPKGSLLIALYGATVGRLAFLGVDATTNQAVASIFCFGGMPNKYLYYYLLFNKSKLLSQRIGGAQPNISQTILNELEVVTPPVNEQFRIVEKIEELFSDLDNGVANLKLAQNQLKVYRQVLFKSAFEGKLTEEWRKKNNPEPAEKLLEKIKQEREDRYVKELKVWKAEVKDWEKDGEKGKKPKKPREVKPLSNISEEELIDFTVFPKGWKTTRLGNLMSNHSADIVDGPFGSNMKSSDYVDNGIPVIKIQNIERNRFLDKKIDYVSPEKAEQLKRHSFISGDIIVTKLGEPLGKACILPDNYPFGIIVADLIRIRINHKLINKKFLNHLINSPYIIKQFEKLTKGTTRQRVNLTLVRELLMCIPSLEEQDEITLCLEEKLSQIENLEKEIVFNLIKSEALKQGILKKAFEGNLVPQDKKDEPAIELLKRIQVEKKTYLEKQKQQKKKAPKKIKKLKKSLIEIIQIEFKDLEFTWEELISKTNLSHIEVKTQFSKLLDKGDELTSNYNLEEEVIKYKLTK